MNPKRILMPLALLVGLAAAGCASARQLAPYQENQVYPLEVVNSTGQRMSISVDDGAGSMIALGEVEAGQSRTFTVEDPSGPHVIVIAQGTDGTVVEREAVELGGGRTARVVVDKR